MPSLTFTIPAEFPLDSVFFAVFESRPPRRDIKDLEGDSGHLAQSLAQSAQSNAAPSTSEDALKLAIKLAVDGGEYERAAALLDVAKRTATPAPVTSLAEERARRDRQR